MATINRVLALMPSNSRTFLKITVRFTYFQAKLIDIYGYFLLPLCSLLNFLLDFSRTLQPGAYASSCSCFLLRRSSSSLSADKKSLIAEGPSLGEFISGEVIPQENPYKRKKGQRYNSL